MRHLRDDEKMGGWQKKGTRSRKERRKRTHQISQAKEEWAQVKLRGLMWQTTVPCLKETPGSEMEEKDSQQESLNGGNNLREQQKRAAPETCSFVITSLSWLSKDFYPVCFKWMMYAHSIFCLYLFQGPEHPNPGMPYSARGFPRYCYLPDNEKGRKVWWCYHLCARFTCGQPLSCVLREVSTQHGN